MDPFAGGYNFTFLAEERSIIIYHCIICKMVARDVHQMSCCGKLVCKTCLEKSREYHGDLCPHCRQKIECFFDRRSHQEILSLMVQCKNIEHGCMKQCELKMMLEHHECCTYEVCVCQACHQSIPKILYKKHVLEDCLRRNFACSHCGLFGPYNDIVNRHYNECPKYPVKCEKCELEMKREELKCHIGVCPKELVQCPYPTCSIVIFREQLAKHKEDCPMKHGAINPTISRMNSQSEDQYTLPLKFSINVSQQEETWTSPGFYTHTEGYRMCFRVYLKGCKHEDHLACYLHLMSGPYDEQLPWPFRGQFEITLINQLTNTHWSKEIKFSTCYPMVYNSCVTDGISQVGLGEPQYIKRCLIETSSSPDLGYLKNDKLVFSIECTKMPLPGCHGPLWLAHQAHHNF